MGQRIIVKILSGIMLIVVFSMTACSDSNGNDEVVKPPKIVVEQESGIYTTKIGKPITISPTYENVENATFAWKIEDKIVGKEKSFTYQSDKESEVFVSLEVTNSAGSDYAEMKINVAALLIPSISLAIPENGYKIIIDGKLELKPEIEEYSTETTYKWYVNGSEVSTVKDYSFSSSTKGTYTLKVVAENEDGSDFIEFPVEVCNAEDLPFYWSFEQTEFSLSTGRNIRIKIWDIENDFGGKFSWAVNGNLKQESTDPFFVFSEKEIGKYTVSVTMKNDFGQLTQDLIVNVCQPEGTYRRTATGGSKSEYNKVYEYLPAPGQFINEEASINTLAEANTFAEGRMSKTQYVSLGGFGGYVIVGFDHSIDNDNDYNIQIIGNSFIGSSEPGIVWVMQDENGNGKPDDTWYELKGSEYGKPETIQDYSVTYYKPRASGMPVQWTDNKGNSGSIDYLASFHRQDYYYPQWVKTRTYTLRGTCLKSRTRETSPGYWVNDEFDWGYADNFSSTDRLTDDDNHNADANGNHFKISNAVIFDGKPANLKYIDFVKIQTGVNTKAGWLGENSTEVFGVNDFNILKKKP